MLWYRGQAVIGRLSGVLVDRFDDGAAIVEVGGVGYDVFVPFGALARLPQPPETVTLHIHTHVREDAFALYGFETLQDREAFRVLIGISGIGPKLALAVLSVIDAKALGEAVSIGDASRFRAIPGVGKKTSERIVLELKDKLRFLHTVGAASGVAAEARLATSQFAANSPPLDTRGLVVKALVQMGYKSSEAERAVANLPIDAEERPVEAVLRQALSALA